MADKFLVTGANCCIGAWVVKLLCAEGTDVVAFDLQVDEHRHRLINSGGIPDVQWKFGDLTVATDVLAAAKHHGVHQIAQPSTSQAIPRLLQILSTLLNRLLDSISCRAAQVLYRLSKALKPQTGLAVQGALSPLHFAKPSKSAHQSSGTPSNPVITPITRDSTIT